MLIQDLEQTKRFFNNLDGPIIGIGMTAFSRIVPASFLPSYRIISSQKTCDLSLLREKVPVFCLGERVPNDHFDNVQNSFQLVNSPIVEEVLDSWQDPKYLFLYQNYPELEKLSKSKGWRLLANPAQLRIRVGERSFFEETARDLRLPKIPGGILPWRAMEERGYGDWAAELGSRFVIQLPDIQKGGGRGTFFVGSRREYDSLRKRLAKGIWRGTRLSFVLVRRFLEGAPASVAICVTKRGVLVSTLQKQLIDLPYCNSFEEKGVFCGHVWGADVWPESVLAEARKQARKVGNHLASMGYRGIAGIDFIVQSEEEKIYPVEINPRLTGAFPMLSLLYLARGIVPMDVFHLLEFLNVPYEVDVEALNRQYARPLFGSHLLVFCGTDVKAGSYRPLRAGLWEYDRERRTCSFLKESLDLGEARDPWQFVIADGPPDGGTIQVGVSDPLRRLCRILFPYPVEDGKGLREEIPAIVNWIQRRCMA